MPFPSLAAAAARARQTAIRFPFAILSGIVAAIAMILMIEGPEDPWHFRVLGTALLGFPLFVAMVVRGERRRFALAGRLGAALVVVVALVLLASTAQQWPDEQAALRFLQLGLVAHLAVAVAAYAHGPERPGFWQWNRILLLRFLLGGVYAGALFVGLALALAALDNLFGVNIRNETYPELWAIMAFVFHPWFTLAGIPKDPEGLDAVEEYPAGLKMFAQFVLLPLVTIYLVILTLYLGKVLITREWPSGWIGWLVSGVSATGVLALLLLHPVRDREDSGWVNAYGRWFFLALLPSLGMLMVAVAQRIGQYGLTEPRYFLLVLALWGIGLGAYYVFTGSRSIRQIPVSLAVVAGLTAFGPWGAYSMSRRSQEGRLNTLLVANGMGALGAATPAGAAPSAGDVQEINAVIRYLNQSHGPTALATALGISQDSVTTWAAEPRSEGVEVAAARYLGIEYRVPRQGGEGNGFNLGLDRSAKVEVAGYGEMGRIWLSPDDRYDLAGLGLGLEPSSDLRSVGILREGITVGSFDLSQALDTLDTAGPQSLPGPVTVDALLEGMELRLVLVNVAGSRSEGRVTLESTSGFLLLRRP